MSWDALAHNSRHEFCAYTPLMVAPLHRLVDEVCDPYARQDYSPLGRRHYLHVDVSQTDGDLPTQKRLAEGLCALPCPVLGVGVADASNVVAQACDVLLPSSADTQGLVENIERAPVAAAMLVQLLRASESLPRETALQMESLTYSTLQAGAEYQAWLADNRATTPAQHADEGPAVVMHNDGTRLTLELNRPSNRNGMTVEMRDGLIEALQLALLDCAIERIALRGRGKCFSTGGDLTEFGTAPNPATAHIVRGLALPGRLLAQCAARTTAYVHGACIGSGIEFPAFAGRIVAAVDAYFQLPELKFGLIPGAGGTVSIARRIGRQRTAWLVLSGKRIKAEQALAWGLVDEISA